MINKLVSLAMALFCMIAAFSLEGPSGFALLIAIVPLLICIWFSELLGSITGIGGFRSPVINKETPGCFVNALGWLGLLVVVVATTKRLL